MDALKQLRCDDADAWAAVFLKYHEVFLQGAKEPDTKFKDFRNHVLHVSDNYWGGAVKTARLWYDRSLSRLKKGDWLNGVYAAGILSHYYTDPIHPFHTGQSEAENNVHRACEWSITKSYEDLRTITEQSDGWPDVAIPDGDDWLEQMVKRGAETSHQHYQTLIDHYDLSAGRKKPKEGLDDCSRQVVAGLTAYAAVGYARILDRLIDEADVEPPRVSLSVETVLASLTMPVKWVTSKMADREEAKLVQRMYEELQEKGRVEDTLPEDDRQVRRLFNSEVLGNEEFEAETVTQTPASVDEFASEDDPRGDEEADGSLKFRLGVDDSLDDAPSIGKKTAARFAAIGIETVGQFLDADAADLAAKIDARHIDADTIEEWQMQAELCCRMPGIYGHDAQILVACGFDDPTEIAAADVQALLGEVFKFAKSSEGQRVLRSSKPPDADEVENWILWAGESRELRAA
jgi:hypothetical protein